MLSMWQDTTVLTWTTCLFFFFSFNFDGVNNAQNLILIVIILMEIFGFLPGRKRGISPRSRLGIFKRLPLIPPNPGVFVRTGGKGEVCLVFPTLALRKPLTSVGFCSVPVRLDSLSVSNGASLFDQHEIQIKSQNKVSKFLIAAIKSAPLSGLHTENQAVLPPVIRFRRNSFVQMLRNMLCVSFPK